MEGIEVLTNGSKSILGTNAPTGAVYITTRIGADMTNNAPRTAAMLTLKNAGFAQRKEFYSPDYDDPATNRALYDLRSTIYWNPNVTTNAKGQGAFSFFNANRPGTYEITIEGMDLFGNMGRKVYTYKVKSD
ncbi:hypothetical protein D9M68_373170 [compost metagenome]